jgi:hypothetical protein
MLTGGVAVIFYGKPRMTHDIDVVVEIDQTHIPKIIKLFKKEFYVSEEAINESVMHKSMFNIINLDSGIKIDFWIRNDNEYDIERFNRRQKYMISGNEIFFSSPEDIILKKLLWYKDSQIDKHLDDTFGILQIQNENLDYKYIKKWSTKLSVSNLLNQLEKQL